MSKLLTKAAFTPHLNTKFQVQIEQKESVDIELVELDEKSNDMVESFSIIFRGPKENMLAQNNYPVKHSKMGEFSLFIVPIIHEKQDGIYYQSVFSRLKK